MPREFPIITFLLDYSTGKYYHFSQNVKQLSGFSQEAFLSEGVDLTLHLCNSEDTKVYYQTIVPLRLKFLQKVPHEKRVHYSFQHNFRFHNKAKAVKTMLQEHSVLKSDVNGNPLVILGICQDITGYKEDSKITDVIKVYSPGEPSQTLVINHFFPKPEDELLTRRELEIVKWILAGLNSRQIADKLYISLETVLTHRKHIRTKTNAKNVAELLAYAKMNNLT